MNKKSSSIYRNRRKRFIAQMLPNSVAFIVSNPECIRSNDSDFPYRQSSDVLYLSGFPEPQSVLILNNIDKKAQFKMVVRSRDKQKEIWTGRRQGIEGAVKKYDADEAFTFDQFKQIVKEMLAKADNVYYKLGHNLEIDTLFEAAWKNSSCSLHNPESIVHTMRMVKEKEELVLMRRAASISAQAHLVAMLVCRPSMMEYEIQAQIEHTFKVNAATPAYNSIVAAGVNAVILHYVENNARLKTGELLLIDAACEFDGYASDITRTFPVNGKFSQPQKEIYNLVLEAQLAAIARAKRGVTLMQLHETVTRTLRKGLIELGVLMPGMIDKAAEEKILKKMSKNGKKTPVVLKDVFMHGTSHWLGLDVHDVGTIGTRSKTGKTLPLKPGMVFTVEPGLYFDPDDKRLPKKYRGIGVRIEDDVAITASGNEVLTSGVPKAVEEIEKLMSRRG